MAAVDRSSAGFLLPFQWWLLKQGEGLLEGKKKLIGTNGEEKFMAKGAYLKGSDAKVSTFQSGKQFGAGVFVKYEIIIIVTVGQGLYAYPFSYIYPKLSVLLQYP